MAFQDTVNGFIKTFRLEGEKTGSLQGLTFAAKDLFDIEGHVTGGGNPDWAHSHAPAGKTAPAVQLLLDHGACLSGKTHTDELAYSLMGVNAHYGTPLNPAAPLRIPGGSSSGSVAVTAGGLVDFGLGTDTGGSVRLPASFCGVYGIRTTHHRIDLSHTLPLAPSFDTCGWFARSPDILAQVGRAYGMEPPLKRAPSRLLIAEDAFDLLEAQPREILKKALDPFLEKFEKSLSFQLAPEGFDEIRKTFITCQGAEIWQTHGAWITQNQPHFGPGVKERFEMASKITQETFLQAQQKRKNMKLRLLELFGQSDVIVLPTSPGPAPFLSSNEQELTAFRMKVLALLSSAGLAGLPQINIPIATYEGGPMGLSLIGAPDQDGFLMDLAHFGPKIKRSC